MGKVNFVEIRTFWHVFRSFDRMWSFYILCLQVKISDMAFTYFTHVSLSSFHSVEICWLSCLLKAMIIIAWNDSGELSSIFHGDVFKKVLSIFITAAILKLAQGRGKIEWLYIFKYIFGQSRFLIFWGIISYFHKFILSQY